ncbi:MAG: GtrA family protein [Ruminococcus sp.]|nr:GtrA family protein [Ruminococcus sp.]
MSNQQSNNKKELIRSLKFVLFSISAGVIQIVSFTLMTEFSGLSYWPCYLISLVLSVLYNFTINRKFTFHSAANVPLAMFKVFLYYCAFTPLSTIGGNYLVESLMWNKYIVELLSMLLNFITEFLFTRFVVYGKQVDNDQRYIEKESKRSKNTLEKAAEEMNQI